MKIVCTLLAKSCYMHGYQKFFKREFSISINVRQIPVKWINLLVTIIISRYSI